MSTVPAPEVQQRSGSDLAEVRALVRQGRIRAASHLVARLRRAPGALLALSPVDRAILLAVDVECRLAVGDVAAAVDTAALLAPTTRVGGLAAAVARYSRSDLAAALGEADVAVEGFLASGEADDSGVVPWRCGAALSMLRLGRRREALDLARTHLDLVTGGDRHDVAHALRTLATTDPDGRGTVRLREAHALLLDTDAERLRAQIGTDLAGLLVLGGRGPEAVVLLRSAETYAGREDLAPLQSRIRRLLQRLGETPRRPEAEVLAVLTAAERRVALLVLDGHTNRAVAEHLMVSVKAVEGHLSRVYRKLGVASRSGLSASLRVAT